MQILKKVSLIMLIAFFGGILLFAQSKPENFKEKMKKIKKGEKIVVSTPDGDVVFEGKDAEKLLERFGAKGFNWTVESDGDDKDFVFFTAGGDSSLGIKKMNKIFMVKDADSDHDLNISISDENRELTIKKDDGETYVKDVFEENGEKKTVELTGKEADEYLVKLKDEGVLNEIESEEAFTFISSDGFMDEPGSHDISISIEDGKKKVIVKSVDEDGKETTKTYEGKEADEFLESNAASHDIHFFSGKGKNKFKFSFDSDELDSIDDSIKVKIKNMKLKKSKVIIYQDDDED